MARQPSQLDQWVEMLSIGPVGGIDPTTPPYYVAPPNYVDAANFVPNHGYGGFVTVAGRSLLLASPLPSVPYGMHILNRQGQPTVYLFAADAAPDVAVGSIRAGALWWAPVGGTPTRLKLPDGASWTSGAPTYFADCAQWVFITNGKDVPLKLDLDLKLSYWGIVAPTVAPTPTLGGDGPLVGTYYYCFTWSNDNQESSQGAISTPIVCGAAQATSTALEITGDPREGDTYTLYAGAIEQSVYSASYTVPAGGLTLFQASQNFAVAINTDPYVAQYVSAGSSTIASTPAGQVLLTAAQTGTQGNQVFFYARVTRGDLKPPHSQITPTVLTLLSGGIDGNSVLLTGLSALSTPDPQVTQLNIYRLGGSLGTWNLIKTLDYPKLPDTYLDFEADADVTGQELVVFRDPPPPFSYIATHMERVFGFGIGADYNPTPNINVTADPSVMWWSNLNEPWGFNSDVNTFTCGDNQFSDVATGLAELGGVLYAQKSRRAYFVYGQTDDNFQPIFAWFIGCQAPRSIATGYGMAFWLGKQGVHFTDGGNRQQISDGSYQQSNIKNILDALTNADYAAAASFIYDRQYYLCLPTLDTTLLWDMRTQLWYKLSFSTPLAAYDLESDVAVIGANGVSRGQVDQWFEGPCDYGAPMVAWIKSRVTDGGDMSATKEFRYAAIMAPFQTGACAKVVVTVDPGCDTQASVPMTVDLGTGAIRHEWPLLLDGYQAQLWMCLEGPGTVDKIAVYGTIKRVHEPDIMTTMSEPLVGLPS